MLNIAYSDSRMSIFNPLRIEVDIAISVIQSNNCPIHLDSLLYSVLEQHFDSHEQVMAEMDKILSKSQGVYHASQALFQRNSSFKFLNHAFLNSKNLSNTIYKKNFIVFGQKLAQVLNFKFNKTVFFAHGNAEKISFYLRTINEHRNESLSWLSAIRLLKVERVVEDSSWFIDDKLNRILPTSIFYDSRNEPIRKCKYQPNYKVGKATDCYVPLTNSLFM